MASWQDSTYQKQISYYKKLAADYAAQEMRRKAELAQYYGTLGTAPQYEKQRTINWKGQKVKLPRKAKKKGSDQTEGLYQRELRQDRDRDIDEILNDYASRGLLHSGLYAKKRGEYETEFGKQLAEINRQRSKMYSDLGTERTAFEREQELQKENARLDAIRRRAAKTGSLNF